MKHLLEREGSSGRRGGVEEAGDQRLARGFIRECHGRSDLEQKEAKFTTMERKKKKKKKKQP